MIMRLVSCTHARVDAAIIYPELRSLEAMRLPRDAVKFWSTPRGDARPKKRQRLADTKVLGAQSTPLTIAPLGAAGERVETRSSTSDGAWRPGPVLI